MQMPDGYDRWKLASAEDEAYLVECDGCPAMVPEEALIPINDSSTDHTPMVCAECAR